MRVLFYNHTGKLSGAERVLMLALGRLDRERFDATAVCPPGPLAHELDAAGIPRLEINELTARLTMRPDRLAASVWSLVRTIIALRSAIRSTGPDVVHANSVRAGIAALFATAGTKMPVIWHIHDELKPHPLTTLIRQMARSRRFRGLAVSEATAETFAGGTRLRDRVAVVRNGVDVNAIDNSPRADLRTELRLPQDSFHFGLIGQITPRKGQLELIEAFARLRGSIPNAHLVLVGSPLFNRDEEYLQQLRHRVVELKLGERIHFLGQRADAIGIMKDLDVIVMNSKSEAFVMVAIEAMACRTPVIATDVGGTREMLENEQNGILLPVGDENLLVTAMERIHAHPELRQRYTANGRRLVETYLNTDRFIKEVDAVLSRSGPHAGDITSDVVPYPHVEQGT